MNSSPPVVLTLAGSDCSAGAGIQADLKTFTALGVHGLTVPTALVAEIPCRVLWSRPLSPEQVVDSLRLLLDSYPVVAMKTGLLGSAEIIAAVTPWLTQFAGPIIVDPVRIASAGTALVEEAYGDALREFITQVATVITPNREEARWLLGSAKAAESGEDAKRAALTLADRFQAAVLLKGGHFAGALAVDWLAHQGRVETYSSPRLAGPSFHGTGCALSAAITAYLARDLSLQEATEKAKQYVHAAIEQGFAWPTATGNSLNALAHLPKSVLS